MTSKKTLLFFLFTLAPVTLLSLWQPEHWQVMALFISIVLLWFSEVVPLAITGLMVPLLAILFQVAPTKEAFLPFGNQILFLFMGSFFLAKAMEKHGWDKRIAYGLLSSPLGGKTLNMVLIQVSVICWVLSMWISNTATCAIMVPIILGLMQTLEKELENQEDKNNLKRSLLLTTAFASSIGGMATPVGSPPNLLAMQFLQTKGISLTFLQWMGYGLPVSLAMLVALIVILRLRFPLPTNELSGVKGHFKEELLKLGSMSAQEKQVMGVFSLAVFLWLLPGLAKLILPASFSETTSLLQKSLPMGGVGILAASFLFVLPNTQGGMNLEWKEANTIDWGTIWLFGGGLTMGSLLDKSGLAASVGETLFGTWSGGDGSFFLIMGLVVIVTGVILSEFSSNTASTAIIVPLLLGSLAVWGEAQTTSLIIAAAFGASFGFMLPVSTPPNAIVYGTGHLPLRDMMRTGILFDISGALIIWAFMFFKLPH